MDQCDSGAARLWIRVIVEQKNTAANGAVTWWISVKYCRAEKLWISVAVVQWSGTVEQWRSQAADLYESRAVRLPINMHEEQ